MEQPQYNEVENVGFAVQLWTMEGGVAVHTAALWET